MSGYRASLLITATLALALSACGDKEGKPPEGQVVATVDGKDVTIHEMNAELGTIRAPAETPRKYLEQLALSRVIERKMLANEARTLKLDARPEYLLSKARADEGLLVQALQADVQGKVPSTTREAAQKYIEQNPLVFSDRRIFTIDQIQFLRPANVEQLPLAGARTMEEVERILIGANIEYRRAPQQIDTLTINPKLTTEILRINNSATPEPFMFVDQPQGAVGPIVFINNVTASKSQPFVGERAITYAEAVLQQQNVQKRLTSELEKWKEAYKSKIVYAEGYSAPDQKLLTKATTPAAATAKPASPTAPTSPAKIDPKDAITAATGS